MRTIIKTTVIGLALCLAACGGEKASGDKAPKQAAKQDKTDKQDKPEAAAAGAADADAEQALALDPKVEQAVTLANKISAEPAKADAILEEAGMDRDSFEKLLYEIARDPDLSASYALAREA